MRNATFLRPDGYADQATVAIDPASTWSESTVRRCATRVPQVLVQRAEMNLPAIHPIIGVHEP